MVGVTSVPLYDTLGEEMVSMIMEETQMQTLFGSDVCLNNTAKLIEKIGRSTMKTFVTFDDEVSSQL